MISRRTFLASGAAVLAAPVVAEAQQPGKVPRIGVVLTLYSSPEGAPEGFKDGLRELGYIEGQNVVIEWRSAAGKYDQLGALVADLIRLKVDVIVADVTRAVLAAKQATKTIPHSVHDRCRSGGKRAGIQPRQAGRERHRMLDPTARHQREAVAASHRSRPCGLARRRALESRHSVSQDPAERGRSRGTIAAPAARAHRGAGPRRVRRSLRRNGESARQRPVHRR